MKEMISQTAKINTNKAGGLSEYIICHCWNFNRKYVISTEGMQW